MGALISFLGGGVFRMLWGEISSFLTKRQDHKHELQLIEIQAKVAAQTHAQNLEAIRVQSELGVKTIQVQRDADVARSEVDAWLQAVKDVGKATGIAWLDAWNGTIRPLLATCAIVVMFQEIFANHGVPTEHVLMIADAILGIYVADRSLLKRGK
jgi:hypothetical protein